MTSKYIVVERDSYDYGTSSAVAIIGIVIPAANVVVNILATAGVVAAVSSAAVAAVLLLLHQDASVVNAGLHNIAAAKLCVEFAVYAAVVAPLNRLFVAGGSCATLVSIDSQDAVPQKSCFHPRLTFLQVNKNA